MKHERYIINEEEIALLERFEGPTASKYTDAESRYDGISLEGLQGLCRLKDRSNDMYFRRTEAAWAVIDLVAAKVGIDPKDTGFWLYAPDTDGSSPIVDRIEEWISRSGDKAQLKRRLQELEQENAILRSLIQK